MLNLRSHKELSRTGSQPAFGFLCASVGWSKTAAGSQGYALVIGAPVNDRADRTPAIGFQANPGVGL